MAGKAPSVTGTLSSQSCQLSCVSHRNLESLKLDEETMHIRPVMCGTDRCKLQASHRLQRIQFLLSGGGCVNERSKSPRPAGEMPPSIYRAEVTDDYVQPKKMPYVDKGCEPRKPFVREDSEERFMAGLDNRQAEGLIHKQASASHLPLDLSFGALRRCDIASQQLQQQPRRSSSCNSSGSSDVRSQRGSPSSSSYDADSPGDAAGTTARCPPDDFTATALTHRPWEDSSAYMCKKQKGNAAY
ncbi:unnamed protein product [Lampetra fluviatilis]